MSWSARWPTNLERVPGGRTSSARRPSRPTSPTSSSPRTSSSRRGGSDPNAITCAATRSEFERGPCCPAPIYDNNTVTGEFELISVNEDDSGFRGVPIEVSDDGIAHRDGRKGRRRRSATPRPLLHPRRRPDLRHRPGALVKYVGMTTDGSDVYFTSSEQLTADDQDTSIDLFRLEDSRPDQLTRVSTGDQRERRR